MHAGVTECHQCRDVCALSRPRDRAKVNLGQRVQCVLVKLTTALQKGRRVRHPRMHLGLRQRVSFYSKKMFASILRCVVNEFFVKDVLATV